MAIASRWRELSGRNNWEGLLHPLDNDLRRYLIHYCQRAGAAGDAFNGTRASKGYAHSLYPADEFFAWFGLETGNSYHYKVVSFIYAATAADEVAYFGYVAVATDQGKAVLGRRDILVSWRGTITQTERGDDANAFQTSAKELFGHDCVQVCKVLQQLVSMYQNEEAYQHAIAGQQENGEFKLEEELEFDNAIINKYTDGLLDVFKIPDNWWTKEMFKNMVQADDGHWKFNDIAFVPDPQSA
ncbi:Detected protein of confused Function [Hibiscus syriacus]|uniref:Phospholipase A1 n=1 Tax=Hibiscus syriacus TaxID=106335 RepID=A0A6A3CZ52_HIBSY|nr:Detected protein of confused Function [Hibiscus syriacus]